tara:strand:- start:965 stop:1546 length:582 start_codon:yes stop_codon:yes gene_type:complete
MSDVTAQKIQLRIYSKSRRALLSASVTSAASDLAENFMEALTIIGDGSIAGYWPIADELDVKPLLQMLSRAGIKVSLPTVIPDQKRLVFQGWSENTQLVKGPYGTLQPHRSSAFITPDILMIPLLAFDAEGGRLGYGGGYYDRTLSELRKKKEITAVGIAYAGQEINEVPTCSNDQRLDWIVTETGVKDLRVQ